MACNFISSFVNAGCNTLSCCPQKTRITSRVLDVQPSSEDRLSSAARSLTDEAEDEAARGEMAVDPVLPAVPWTGQPAHRQLRLLHRHRDQEHPEGEQPRHERREPEFLLEVSMESLLMMPRLLPCPFLLLKKPI